MSLNMNDRPSSLPDLECAVGGKTFSLIFDDYFFKLTATSLDGPSGNRAILEAKVHVAEDSFSSPREVFKASLAVLSEDLSCCCSGCLECLKWGNDLPVQWGGILSSGCLGYPGAFTMCSP